MLGIKNFFQTTSFDLRVVADNNCLKLELVTGCDLTLSQMTSFRLFQAERHCR